MATETAAEERTESPSDKPAKKPATRAERVLAILAHPFALLLTGAILSNLLIPEWNRRSEVHQRELTVKTDLSTRINEAVVTMLTATQAAAMGARGQSQEDFDRAFMTWQVRRAVLATDVTTYADGSSLPRAWEALADGVEEAYGSVGVSDPALRRANLLGWGARRAALDRQRNELLRRLMGARLTPFR